jgi:hypothetical protein
MLPMSSTFYPYYIPFGEAKRLFDERVLWQQQQENRRRARMRDPSLAAYDTHWPELQLTPYNSPVTPRYPATTPPVLCRSSSDGHLSHRRPTHSALKSLAIIPRPLDDVSPPPKVRFSPSTASNRELVLNRHCQQTAEDTESGEIYRHETMTFTSPSGHVKNVCKDSIVIPPSLHQRFEPTGQYRGSELVLHRNFHQHILPGVKPHDSPILRSYDCGDSYGSYDFEKLWERCPFVSETQPSTLCICPPRQTI